MIGNALLWVIHLFLSFVANLLSAYPDVTPNASITGAVSTANSYFSALQDFIPNDAILGATGALLFFELAYAAYKVIRWAYQKIPGIN